MKTLLNNKIISWPSEWPAPAAGMVIYDSVQNLEIIRVTWVLPTVGAVPDGGFVLNEHCVLLDAQPTFHQMTEEEMFKKTQVS